ncbi:hypothetical protein QOT17_019517 [Balamuthia mandrillaris]
MNRSPNGRKKKTLFTFTTLRLAFLLLLAITLFLFFLTLVGQQQPPSATTNNDGDDRNAPPKEPTTSTATTTTVLTPLLSSVLHPSLPLIPKTDLQTWGPANLAQRRIEFFRHGVLGPFSLSPPSSSSFSFQPALFSSSRAQLYASYSSSPAAASAAMVPFWLQDRQLLSLALHPALIRQVRVLLGNHVLLYDVSLVDLDNDGNGGEPQGEEWHVDEVAAAMLPDRCNHSLSVLLNIQEKKGNEGKGENVVALKVLSGSNDRKVPVMEEGLRVKVTPTSVVVEEEEEKEESNVVSLPAIRVEGSTKVFKYEVAPKHYLLLHSQVWYGFGSTALTPMPPKVTPSRSTNKPNGKYIILRYAKPECSVRSANHTSSIQYSSPAGLPPTLLVSGTLEGSTIRKGLNNVWLIRPSSLDNIPSSSPTKLYRPNLSLTHHYQIEIEDSPFAQTSNNKPHPPMQKEAFFRFPTGEAGLKEGQQRGGMLVFQFTNHSTPSLDKQEIHMSKQLTFRTPHMPHSHLDEELIYIARGTVRITRLPFTPSPSTNALYSGGDETGLSPSLLPPSLPEETLASAGDVIYHPSFTPHTITAHSQPTSDYVCIRFSRSSRQQTEQQKQEEQHGATLPPLIIQRSVSSGLESTIIPSPSFPSPSSHQYEQTTGRQFLNGKTSMLSQLEGHTTVLLPGKGYDPHHDDYDVLVIVEVGEVKAMPESRVMRRGDMLYVPAGQPHGLRNVGQVPSRHVAFEFHP